MEEREKKQLWDILLELWQLEIQEKSWEAEKLEAGEVILVQEFQKRENSMNEWKIIIKNNFRVDRFIVHVEKAYQRLGRYNEKESYSRWFPMSWIRENAGSSQT